MKTSVRGVAGVLAGLVGCAAPAVVAPTVPVEHRVEELSLPPDPAAEPLPPGTPAGDWVEPAEKGQTLTRSGILMSEGRAVRDGFYRLRYNELRLNYAADRRVWGAQRELYEARLRLSDDALKQAEPGWFQQHGFQLGVAGGFVLGAAMTVALTYALHNATK